MALNLVTKQFSQHFFRSNLLRPNCRFLPTEKYFSKMEQPVKGISFESLKDRLLNNSIKLIDVREPKELKEEGKIPHSVNIPVGEIEKAFQLPNSEFQKSYGIEKPEKSDEFVISCRSGRRATNAFNKLEPLGYKNILVYFGSFEEWKSKNGPIEKD